MQTDRIKVASDGSGRERALHAAEKFAEYVGLGHREGLQLRLLAEETLGMAAAITERFDAEFWIEQTEHSGCRLHLLAKTDMNRAKKKELVAVSTRGRNEAAKGFMGKIRELIEDSLSSGAEELKLLGEDQETGPAMYASLGMSGDSELMATDSLLYLWSLERYRANIKKDQGSSPEVRQAWDELEKSIVANIADDVRVSVSGKTAELIIEKRF